MSSDYYVRQFGERDRFAITLSFGHDPHPTGDKAVDAAWGSLSLWVHGRCLTRNVSSEGAVSEGVQWSLNGLLQWLVDAGARLVNEEPFPEAVKADSIRDACDWLNASQTPLLRLTEEEEDEWFLRRSEWRQHHSLRSAAIDAALPNVLIRRVGDFLEVSWDNETWAASRPDLRFVEQRGTELVPASRAAADIHAALVDATKTLAERYDLPETKELLRRATESYGRDDDWRWLVHEPTARVIEADITALRDELGQHTRTRRQGLYVPHRRETLVLRHARLVSATEILALLGAAAEGPHPPLQNAVLDLIRPTPAATTSPWKEGYEMALRVRQARGWGDDPLPDLHAWLKSNGVATSTLRLSRSIDLVARRTEDQGASAIVNPETGSYLRREIAEATAFGHILMDQTPIAVDGTWEHWPTAARARAFAAMLLLPEDGIREALLGEQEIRAEAVRRVMALYKTGPYATTYHLKNLGFIADDEQRVEILRDLTA